MNLMQRRRALMAEKGSGKSDMNGWTSGVAYTDIDIIKNQYYKTTGQIINYNGWDRTGYIPCNGAGSLVFLPTNISADWKYNCFFTKNGTFIRNFIIDEYNTTTITVPANAYYFGVSQLTTAMAKLVNNQKIIPYA